MDSGKDNSNFQICLGIMEKNMDTTMSKGPCN